MNRIPHAILRRGIQLAAFILSGSWLAIGATRCPFAVPYVSCLSCSVTNCPGRRLLPWALGAAVLSQLVRPRAFCAYLCPAGLLQDVLGGRLGRRRYPTGGARLRLLKYAALVAVAVAFFLFDRGGGRAFDYVVRSPRVIDPEAMRVAAALGLLRYPVRWILVAATLVFGLFVTRWWCRFLCPLGAALAAASRLSPRRLTIDPEQCSDCGLCRRHCPMGTSPETAECISCGVCADVCIDNAIAPARRRRATSAPPPETAIESET